MEFKQLVSYCKPMRQLKTDLIIVITSFDSYGLVVSHLKLLSKQTYQRFNVLLVLGVAFDDKKLGAYLEENQFAFGIILAKENDRRGCSGGFFTGQKYALENGYEYIIMADDDCMPVDKGLVEALYSKRAAKYVRPTTVFVAGSYRKKGFAAGPSQYSLYSAEVFREYGLYYLPLYHGADDGEYMERVKQPYIHIPNNTEHPYISGMRLFGVFDRQWLFMLQSLIIMRSIRTTLYNLTQYAFMAAVSLCFLPPYGRRLFVLMNGLLLTYTYGKEANRRVRSGYEKSILPSLPNSPFVKIDERSALRQTVLTTWQ
jgi:hypothetical protein